MQKFEKNFCKRSSILLMRKLISILLPFRHLNNNILYYSHGTQALSLKSFIQPIVSLLGDPCGPVRDASIHTLVEIYKHVGMYYFIKFIFYPIMN